MWSSTCSSTVTLRRLRSNSRRLLLLIPRPVDLKHPSHSTPLLQLIMALPQVPLLACLHKMLLSATGALLPLLWQQSQLVTGMHSLHQLTGVSPLWRVVMHKLLVGNKQSLAIDHQACKSLHDVISSVETSVRRNFWN